MGDAYSGIITPYNTKQFDDMQADIRGHLTADGAALQDVGIDLRRLLPHAKGASGRDALGVDLKIAAWRVARCFAQADASCRAAAAAVGKGYTIYYGTFHNPQAGRTSHGKTFDAS